MARNGLILLSALFLSCSSEPGGSDSGSGCSAAVDCDDGNACTHDICSSDGACENPTIFCDDGDACTDEVCVTGVGCQVTGVVCIDIRADVNRDGIVDMADPTDDANETTWDAAHGAVFLANIDDDQEVCPTSGSDAELAACHDAADAVINGSGDLLDLARIRVKEWPGAPDDAGGTISVDAEASNHVRLFLLDGATSPALILPATLSTEELRTGVELGIEANDVLRDPTGWNGIVDVTLDVDAGSGPGGAYPDGSDSVRLRVAPLIFRHAIDPVEVVFATAINTASSSDFRNDLQAAMTAAGVSTPLSEFSSVLDLWTRDLFENAYMSIPAAGGQHIISVNLRSANYSGGGLRNGGRVVYTDLRGPDVAGLTQYDPTHPDGMDTLNSCGNLEVVPPHGNWPFGRVLRGRSASFYPDASVDALIEAQGQQAIIEIDVSAFTVAHVNQLFNFVPSASGQLGWQVLVPNPSLARTMLEDAQSNGFGAAQMFVGSASVCTIDDVLADPDLVAADSSAVLAIDDAKTQLKTATGLTDADFISVPALFATEFGGFLSPFMPSIVQGVTLTSTAYAAPDPRGPQIDGTDLFKSQFEGSMAALGITVYWIEDWDLYHDNLGEVHDGTNDRRVVPDGVLWWETGL